VILSEVETQPASAIPPAAAQKIFDRMLNVPVPRKSRRSSSRAERSSIS